MGHSQSRASNIHLSPFADPMTDHASHHISPLPTILPRWHGHLIFDYRPVRRFLRPWHSASTDLDSPSDVVPILRPSLRDKGLHFGRWRLIRSDATRAEEEHDSSGTHGKDDGRNGAANGAKEEKAAAPPTNGHKPKAKTRPMARIMITDLLEPGLDSPKYEFEMELGLRETARGK